MLAALAPRFGGSADGADRSQKIARVNPLDHPLRAREDGAIRACDGPTGAAPILFHLFAGGGADRPARIELDQVDRPLPSYGVSFDNTPFAAALRLAQASSLSVDVVQRQRHAAPTTGFFFANCGGRRRR